MENCRGKVKKKKNLFVSHNYKMKNDMIQVTKKYTHILVTDIRKAVKQFFVALSISCYPNSLMHCA